MLRPRVLVDIHVHGYGYPRTSLFSTCVMKLVSKTTKFKEGEVIHRSKSRLKYSTRSRRRDVGAVERAARLSAMVQLRVLVPLRDNDGRDFPPDYFRAVEQFLLRRGGGFTRFGIASGRWLDALGTAIVDDTIPYVVLLPEERAVALASDLHVIVRTLFEQDAVYIELTAVKTFAPEEKKP